MRVKVGEGEWEESACRVGKGKAPKVLHSTGWRIYPRGSVCSIIMDLGNATIVLQVDLLGMFWSLEFRLRVASLTWSPVAYLLSITSTWLAALFPPNPKPVGDPGV